MTSRQPKPVGTAKPPVAATPARKSTPSTAAQKPPVKTKKAKLVRDSFTFPKQEYEQIAALKARAEKLGSPVKKSELLRAGIMALTRQKDSSFLLALKAVPALKTGRPSKA